MLDHDRDEVMMMMMIMTTDKIDTEARVGCGELREVRTSCEVEQEQSNRGASRRRTSGAGAAGEVVAMPTALALN